MISWPRRHPALGLDGISKSQVSRLCQALAAEVERFRSRRLSGGYPSLWLDATFGWTPRSSKSGTRGGSQAVVVAIAVTATGEREVLGLDIGPSEDGAFWLSFLRGLVARGLVARGLGGVPLVISDAHEGLRQAIAAVRHGAAWHRCRVHFVRNALAAGFANTPRGVIANACHGFAYVSIHLNSFHEPEPNYTRTFWGIEDKDAGFAAVMQLAIVNGLQPETDLGDSGLEQLENGGLLTARMPAILIEPLFMSNPDEAARLADPDGARLDAIAQAVADGVDVWLRSRGQGPIAAEGQRFRMTPDDPLLAPPRGTAAQAIATGLAGGARQPAAFWAYVMEVYRLAPQVGIDPAIVIAQSALETGWWQSPAWSNHLNPAGIGITGPEAVSPIWASGVEAARAQLVHLYLYAVGPIPPDHPLAPYIPLDPRYDAALSAGRAGNAPQLEDLARNWATDPDYATSIARVGTQIFRE